MPITTTVTVTSTLDVIGKYEALVRNSLDGESVYIRAKETLQDLFNSSDITGTERAQALSSVIGSMVGSITTSSMATALEWAKAEKDLELRKLELDQQLAILSAEFDLKTAQKDQVDVQNRLAKVESKRMFGTGVFDADGNLISLADEGKVFNDMELVDQQTINATKEATLLDSKVEESKVAIHKIVADTYVNFGSYNFTLDPSGYGIDTITSTHGAYQTLSDVQKDIAVEQGKGYVYNAWANAATGAASMVGTAIASGDFNFAPGTSGDVLLRTVINCLNNLRLASGNDASAVPITTYTMPNTINP